MKLFKKSIVPLIILSMSAPLTCLADCPPSSDIKITQNADGTYTVTPPPGYQYGGASYPISATGPIALSLVQLSSNSSDMSKVIVTKTDCSYGINGSSGSYPGGVIVIYNSEKFITMLDPQSWSRSGFDYMCVPWKNNCSFAKQ